MQIDSSKSNSEKIFLDIITTDFAFKERNSLPKWNPFELHTSVGMNEKGRPKEQTSTNFNGKAWNLDGEIVFSFHSYLCTKNSYAWKVVLLNHNEIHELHILFVAHSRSWLNSDAQSQKMSRRFVIGKALKSLVLFFFRPRKWNCFELNIPVG